MEKMRERFGMPLAAGRTLVGTALGVLLGWGLLYCWFVQMWLGAAATLILVAVLVYVARTSQPWRRFSGAVLVGTALAVVALLLAILVWGLANAS